jgi:hypothetical protein
MSLTELIAGVEAHEKTLAVFNASDAVAEELRSSFTDRNVTVTSERTPSGKPGDFVTLSVDGEVETATGIADLQRLLDGDVTLDLSERPYRPILDHLDETMFTTWSTRKMVAASREIEDRAWRVGEGRVDAGFQFLSTLRGELPTYERLAERGIEVHAYAAPDEARPDYEGLSLHVEHTEEIERSWFVVYDGAGDDDQKCALLAEEREPRSFYGFWTYDPSTVDWILEYLDATYGPMQSQ